MQGIQECLDDSGWTLVQDGDLRLLYRHAPGGLHPELRM
jgi:hypothetical protein